jgi:hypothetical protein
MTQDDEPVIFSVQDRGIAGQERVNLLVRDRANLAEWALIVCFGAIRGDGIPLRNLFFWLGGSQVIGPAWIVVYTGPTSSPSPIHTRDVNSGLPMHVYHWGNAFTVFNQETDVPALIRLSSVSWDPTWAVPPPALPPTL